MDKPFYTVFISLTSKKDKKKPQTVKQSQFSLSLSLAHGNYIVYAQHIELSQLYCGLHII